MRSYAWGDPDDFDRPRVDVRYPRPPRTEDEVDKLAAFIERHELGSLNVPAAGLVSGDHVLVG